MTLSRALWFKKNKIAVLEKFVHFLPQLYSAAMSGDGKSLFSLDGLALGEQLQDVARLDRGVFEKKLLNLNKIEAGKERKLLITGNLSQEFRRGKVQNICGFIGDLFEKENLSIAEVNVILENKFGPALGLSYTPTINRQLRAQAIKRNLKIQTSQIEGSKKLRYHYIDELK